jgi:uncharacterized protein YndB with AHSA1/START domain
MSESYSQHIDIDASPDRVFDCFLDPQLLVQWMGDFARLEAKAGGIFSVDINGVLIRGHYVVIERPHKIEIAWGEAGNSAMPPSATRLVVTLEARGEGTRLLLEHSGFTLEEAQKHAMGWPHFLGRLQVFAAGKDPGKDPWAEIKAEP